MKFWVVFFIFIIWVIFIDNFSFFFIIIYDLWLKFVISEVFGFSGKGKLVVVGERGL